MIFLNMERYDVDKSNYYPDALPRFVDVPSWAFCLETTQGSED